MFWLFLFVCFSDKYIFLSVFIMCLSTSNIMYVVFFSMYQSCVNCTFNTFAGIHDAIDWNLYGKQLLNQLQDQPINIYKKWWENHCNQYFVNYTSILYTYFWSCVNASERIPLLHAGKAYNGARLNVRQTSTIPRSPAVIRYSPSRDNNIHLIGKNKLFLLLFYYFRKQNVYEVEVLFFFFISN